MYSDFSFLKGDPFFYEKLLLLKLSCISFPEEYRSEIEEIILHVKNWDKFTYLVDINGVAALCCNNIQRMKLEGINGNALENLQKYVLKLKIKNTLRMIVMKEVIGLLESEDIKFVMMKGYQFIKRFYKKLDLRDIGDIDFLLRDEYRKKALQIIRKQPFKEIKMPYVHHVMFFSQKYDVQVELHDDIISPPHYFQYELDDFFNNTVRFKDEQLDVEVFNNDYELYLQLMSALYAHAFLPFKARNITDIHALLSTIIESAVWETIYEKVRLMGASNYLLVSLKISQDLFHLEPPGLFIEELKSKKFAGKYKLFAGFLFHYLEYYADLKHRKNAALLQIKLADTYSRAAYLFIRYVFLPREYVYYSREKLKVPLFLFYLMRIFLLPARFLYKSLHIFIKNLAKR